MMSPPNILKHSQRPPIFRWPRVSVGLRASSRDRRRPCPPRGGARPAGRARTGLPLAASPAPAAPGEGLGRRSGRPRGLRRVPGLPALGRRAAREAEGRREDGRPEPKGGCGARRGQGGGTRAARRPPGAQTPLPRPRPPPRAEPRARRAPRGVRRAGRSRRGSRYPLGGQRGRRPAPGTRRLRSTPSPRRRRVGPRWRRAAGDERLPSSSRAGGDAAGAAPASPWSLLVLVTIRASAPFPVGRTAWWPRRPCQTSQWQRREPLGW